MESEIFPHYMDAFNKLQADMVTFSQLFVLVLPSFKKKYIYIYVYCKQFQVEQIHFTLFCFFVRFNYIGMWLKK